MRSMTRLAHASIVCPRHPTASAPPSSHLAEARPMPDDDAIRCDACPVLCYIKPGRLGSCDRYGNQNGKLVRIEPHVVLDRAVSRGETIVPFLERQQEW